MEAEVPRRPSKRIRPQWQQSHTHSCCTAIKLSLRLFSLTIGTPVACLFERENPDRASHPLPRASRTPCPAKKKMNCASLGWSSPSQPVAALSTRSTLSKASRNFVKVHSALVRKARHSKPRRSTSTLRTRVASETALKRSGSELVEQDVDLEVVAEEEA